MGQEKRDPLDERLTRLESDITGLKSDIASLKRDVAWLKELYRSLDYRVWFIVAGVILTILISLLR
jgi:hypothetical protein